LKIVRFENLKIEIWDFQFGIWDLIFGIFGIGIWDLNFLEFSVLEFQLWNLFLGV
jgi:hypothetical protein